MRGCGKKNVEYLIDRELEISRIVQRVIAEKDPDMEAWEQAILEASLAAGAKVLASVLAAIGTGRREPVLCVCGTRMRSIGVKSKQATTLMGKVAFPRSLFVCPDCRASRLPGDELLDMSRTGFSPGVRRLMARAGAKHSFVEAEEDLRVYAHLHVDRRDIERVAENVGRQIEALRTPLDQSPPLARPSVPVMYVEYDGTAAPMRKSELTERKGKRPNAEPKGREVKVGCVFTQTGFDDKGRPVRDESSTTYVAGIESSTFFGNRIYAEALDRGIDTAQRVVVLTDGAAYNRTIKDMHFPQALHIVDIYHAREHLHNAAKLLRIETTLEAKWSDMLDQGNVEQLVENINKHLPRSGPRRKDARKEIEYFKKNADRMRYDKFKAQGLFVGSGVIEAGCRTVICQRFKQPGMFWSTKGAHALMQVRCSILSQRYNDDWEELSQKRTNSAA